MKNRIWERSIIKECRHNKILASAFSKLFDPVEFNSPQAQEMKQRYLRRRSYRDEIEKPTPLDPSPSESIMALLDDFDSGNHKAWIQLTRYLTLEPSSTHFGSIQESDLRKSPGWKAANAQIRTRLLNSAKQYLEVEDSAMDGLLEKNQISDQAIAGFKAFRLLYHEEPGWHLTVSKELYGKWTSAIIAYLLPGEDANIQKEFLKIFYQYAPDESLNCLGIIIDDENKRFKRVFIIWKFELCWDRYFTKFLLHKAKDQNLKFGTLCNILGSLLEHNADEIRSFTDSYISSPPPTFGEERQRSIDISSILMAYARDAGWSTVWPAICHDYKFGKQVIQTIEGNFGHRMVMIEQKLNEKQIADFYIWLVKYYPFSEDPNLFARHSDKLREEIGMWRDSILEYLSRLGTPESCREICRIAEELPNIEVLKYRTTIAVRNCRDISWIPAEPKYILEFFKNQEKRLVESGNQLLEILIESLKRLEAKLHSETPASRDIWDYNRERNVYSPIYENELSDYIKRHLLDDIGNRGIILGREVQISRGERTDIHVDAIGKRGADFKPITAIIEVKGCWNDELSSAMQSQLKNRYLGDHKCKHGLYLIGWFNCDKWDKDDRNYKRSPKIGIEEARKIYNKQASQLSDSEIRIKAYVLDASL